MDCAVSQYAADEGAVECEYCPTGRTSLQGSPTCSLAAVDYFLQEPKTRSSSVPAETASEGDSQLVYILEAKPCPTHATCVGGNAM